MAEVFQYSPSPVSLDEYWIVSGRRAGEALKQAGFRAPQKTPTRTFDELFGFSARPLQTAIASAVEGGAPLCIVVEAPMGEGKTEAALYASHILEARGVHDGAYIALPTQATANQMFNRLSDYLVRTKPDQRINLQLLHGEAAFDARVTNLLRAVYGASDSAGLVCEPWFLSKKRSLLAPFGAGTVDQALLGVLRTKHAFVRQFGLSGKTVILDEVHAYDTYTSTLLERLIAWLGALGASVILLSATLPSGRRKRLLEAYAGRELAQPKQVAYPRLTVVSADRCETATLETDRPSVRLHVEWLDDELARAVDLASARALGGANVAIVRNTVVRAQETFRALMDARLDGRLPRDIALLLLHSRFAGEDRRRLEAELESKLGKNAAKRPQGMIVVGTQVLEQSLDVDFDTMITDLAPVDLLLQRAGRVHRHSHNVRPDGAKTPTIYVVRPSGELATVSMREVAIVYEPYILRRTLISMLSCGDISLPEDIEALVEDVYTRETPPEWVEALRPEHDAMEKHQRDDAQLAKTRVWPPPTRRDDPFADLDMPFREDDPEVAKSLRAETRLGEKTAEIVCLFGTPQRAFLDRDLERPIDLVNVPTRDLVRALALRTVRIGHRGVVRALAELDSPASWKDVSVLQMRRALFFGHAPIAVGEYLVQLDRELGLIVMSGRGENNAVPVDD